MANIDRVNGLRPVKYLNGVAYTGAVTRYFIPSTDSTAMFIGDAVKSAGSADANGVATIAQCAAGDAVRGVIVGFESETADSPIYRVASTDRYALVADAPDLVFEIQEDGAIAATAVGNNADIVVATGNTTTGTSGMELDSSTAATTAATLRILGLVQRTDNEIGTNSKLLVLINEHELKATAGA